MSDIAPFQLRGLKGLWWEPRRYLRWPALLGTANYNFLMLCYTFCPEVSLRWRHPLPPSDQAIIRQLLVECAGRGIELCLAINPFIGGQSWAPDDAAVRFHPTLDRSWFVRYWQRRGSGNDVSPDPPFEYGSAADLEILVGKCRLAQDWGIRAFALCLDDIDPDRAPAGFSGLAEAQSWLVGRLWASLRSVDPTSRLYVVPTYYWTRGARAQIAYTTELARRLPTEISVFWTGEEVRSHAITAAQAREAAALFGRKPIVWHNYASNDSFRFALQLPPARPPAAELSGEVAGLVVNPMRQVRLTRLHALVMGEYLSEPTGYQHGPALSRAARRLVGESAAPLLERAVEAWAAYPDPRTLTDDLARGDARFLDELVRTLETSRDQLSDLLPRLARLLASPELHQELDAGATRMRLLVEALELRRLERNLSPAPRRRARDRLLAQLAGVDPETACDARLVLDVDR